MIRNASRYRKVSVRMWGDEKFCALSKPKPNGQSLWQYLITGPHTTILPCAFSAGEASLAESLGWPISSFRKAFKEALDKGMVQADWKAHLVFMPNGLKHNPPANPNVVMAWRAAFNELPPCPLKVQVYGAVIAYLEHLKEGMPSQEAFMKAFGEDYVEALPEGLGKTVTVTGTGTVSGAVPETETEREDPLVRFGEFQNVLLNPEDIDDLRYRMNGQLDALIAELDLYGENHRTKFKAYTNHKAVLLTWYARRKEGMNGQRESEAEGKARRTHDAAERLRNRVAEKISSRMPH